MMGCRKIRGLIAASAYEELAPPERRALERHLAACEACRTEAGMLARVAAKIPRVSPEIGIDLGPRLRARLAEERDVRRAPAWRWGMAGALAAAALIGVVAFQAGWVEIGPGGLSVAMAPHSSARKSLDEAQTLLAAHKYTDAYEVLSSGVAQDGNAPAAGRAQMMLAELAFEHHWYDRADEAYKTLMTRYSDAVQAVPAAERARILDRWNMLDEGRKTRYALLQELDRARMTPEGAFETYEGVVAKAPTSYAAQTAVREMVALAGNAAPAGTPQDVVTAMQAVKGKCKNPIAVAKLDLEIGLSAWHELKDLNLAQDSLRKVETSGEPVLAQRAREALTEIAALNPS